jgi:hypothetical protein
VLYGPGALYLQAGRNIGPFEPVSGVLSIGDGSNAGPNFAVKSYLPQQSADIYTVFGVGPGIDYQSAVTQFVDPASAGSGGINFLASIAQQLGETEAQAWITFEGLPALRQHLLLDRAFLDFIGQIGIQFNDPASPNFKNPNLAYQAIGTLFPAAFGYTNNAVSPATRVTTGSLDTIHSLIETQLGGDINLIGPGGNILAGSNSSDTLLPNQQGILTLSGGSIRAFTDGNVIVNQSRIFTEQGGDIDLFSANGDLNAGKGPKSSAAFPPLRLICDVDGFCQVNPAGLVTGAGIGALLSIPGQDPSKSNVSLVAPHGTVDAGAAGIRVAGNLNIAALFVLNAFNIQVQGVTVGIPTTQAPPLALSATSNAAAATQQAGLPKQDDANASKPSIIIVEVLGYGGGDGDSGTAAPPASGDEKRRTPTDRQSYDPNGMFRVIGSGELTGQQMDVLTPEERRRKASIESSSRP